MKALPSPLLPNGDYALRDSDAEWLQELLTDPADEEQAAANVTPLQAGTPITEEPIEPTVAPTHGQRSKTSRSATL